MYRGSKQRIGLQILKLVTGMSVIENSCRSLDSKIMVPSNSELTRRSQPDTLCFACPPVVADAASAGAERLNEQNSHGLPAPDDRCVRCANN